MTAVSFLILARHSAPVFAAFARHLRPACRPGDQIVVVDDGSQDDTALQILRFAEREGWPDGVAVRNLLCDGLGLGSHRPGRDPMAALALAWATADHVIFLDPATPPTDLGPWLDAARVLSGPQVDGVIGGDHGGPLSAQRQHLRPASLFNALWRRAALLPQATTTAPPPTELELIWQAVRPQQRLVGLALQHGAELPPPPSAQLLQAVVQLWHHAPDRAEAQLWLGWHLPALLAGLRPGGLSAALAALGTDAPTLGTILRFRRTATAAPPGASLRKAIRACRSVAPPMPIPPVIGRAPLAVALLGPHAKRMPLSYAALAPLWAGQIAVVPAAKADLLLYAHPRDVAQIGDALADQLAAQPRPMALFSEEPFWDSLFSPDALADRVTLAAGAAGQLRLAQINHHSSDVYEFDRIPYYLLTNHRFANSYATRFARNARLGAAQWAEAFAARQTRSLFMAERRTEAFHNLRLPEGDVVGLCAWRSEVTEACRAGPVQRLGRGWTEGPTRFELIDWHLDKMVRLDGAARQISGLENTHQPCYISEKLFDAFACGARPIYFASPGHRVHDLGLPGGAWLNLWDLPVPDAARQVDDTGFDAAFFADFAVAQHRLAELFSQPRLWVAERARLQQAVIRALHRAASGPAAMPV